MDGFKKLLATSDPPELGPGPRAGIQSEAELNATLDERLKQAKLPTAKQQLIRALVLLWHDHLEAAHVIAQAIENSDGAFVHGIIHRREPDYGNAKYWFRRVGQHAAFSELVSRASVLLESKAENDLRDNLISDGEWDAFAFIDACENAAGRRGSADRQRLLREIQAIESEALLNWLCRQS